MGAVMKWQQCFRCGGMNTLVHWSSAAQGGGCVVSATACWKNFPCRFAVWLAESHQFSSRVSAPSAPCHLHVIMLLTGGIFVISSRDSLLVLCQMLFSLQFLLFHTLPDSCFQHIEWILFSYVICCIDSYWFSWWRAGIVFLGTA